MIYPASNEAPTEGATPLIRNLPQLTVVSKGGISYCADNISLCIHDGGYCLSFTSSGHLVILPAYDIASVNYTPDGRSWCNQCDGAITSWPQHSPPEWVVPDTTPDTHVKPAGSFCE